ncbi:MAG: TAT-variant-translocated molybdopterin oxidoreductase [Ignavibacteriaceae bacterium]
MSDFRKDLNNEIKSENPDPNYWRSFEELYQNKEVLAARHHEFEQGVTDDFNLHELPPVSRRKFLALLGASAALAGTACTDYRDKGEIIPYNEKPEEITLGKANYYASTCTDCANSCGILIKTREGRPIKVDGNPDHPVNKGKICAKGQASILNLYDPERLSEPMRKRNNIFSSASWKDIDDDIIAALSLAGSKEIAIITNTITSPTAFKVFEDFKKKYPTTKIYSYELFNDEIRNSAWKKSYGSGLFPSIKWNEAKIIVTLDADILGTEGNTVETSRLFSEGRDVIDKNFNRLYSVESSLSLTGINADYRLRLKPEEQINFMLSILNELSKKGVNSAGVDTSGHSLDAFISNHGLNQKKVYNLVNDLFTSQGQSIIYAGNHLPENIHLIVNHLNEVLGNTKLYNMDSQPVKLSSLSNMEELEDLIGKMNNNRVAAVIHYDCNPVYHLPLDLGYADAIKNQSVVVALSERESETTFAGNYVLPINHNFECWGDAKTRTGLYSLQQPVINPLHNTRQKEAILLTWISGKSDSFNEKIYHNYLMNNWEVNIYPITPAKIDFKRFWHGALHDGITFVTESKAFLPAFNVQSIESMNDQAEGYTVILKENMFIGDGRYSHNGWLQELPHPVSKISWDNYAAVSERTAKSLNVEDNDVIEININGNKIEIPVFMQAGNSDNTITIELGYGRIFSGTVATGVGFNANVLLSKKGGVTPWIYSGASVTRKGYTYKLASSQEHHAFDNELVKDLHKKRHIIQEGTVHQYLINPSFIKDAQHPELDSVYKQFEYTGVKWGMAIDLNKCTGCSHCVVACNVENNIPVVGKDQVLKSREMQWMRIDRYYSGSADEPEVSLQPMLCQHCDQAPCENVCPVAATTHSPDGLNQMVYNRCVGTRYCSNNCPYKVRRFNFFNFRDHFRDGYQENSIFSLLHNPEVTVRSRGVMEKCTFCVQRISEAKSDAIKNNNPVKGSDVVTACQDACPTNAISFGDINNPEEEFYKHRNHELGYHVLEELNVKPNVTYIAKLRNIHSEDA